MARPEASDRSKCSSPTDGLRIGHPTAVQEATLNAPSSPPPSLAFRCHFCGNETPIPPHHAYPEPVSAGYRQNTPTQPDLTSSLTVTTDPRRWLYFSRAEQDRLAEQRADLIAHSVDLALQTLYNNSDARGSSSQSTPLDRGSASLEKRPTRNKPEISMDGLRFPPRPSTGGEGMQRTFFDSSHDDAGVAEPPPDIQRHPRERRGSIRKTISHIADVGARRFSHETARPPISPGLAPPRKSWALPRRASTSTPAPLYVPAPLQHYQDPDARMKLKISVASPENFEDALQFGYPSTPKKETFVAPKTPRTSLQAPLHLPRNSTNDAPNFLKGNSLSFLDVEDDDDESEDDKELYYEGLKEHAEDLEVNGMGDDELSDHDDDDDDNDSLEVESPVTPDDRSKMVFPPLPASTPLSDGRTPTSTLPRKFHDGDGPGWPTAREMTLRMTLTRPELRDHDGESYGQQLHSPTYSNDPFALEPLQTSQEAPAAFAEGGKKHESGKVRNLFRKMKPSSNRR